MTWQWALYVLTLLLTAVLSAGMGLVVWRRRAAPGGAPLALFMLAVVEWSLSAGIETAVVPVPLKILWSQISHLGIVSAPVLYLLFALEYNQEDKWLTPRRRMLLWVAPAINLGMAWTNDYHHLIWDSLTPNPAGHNLLVYGHGDWFWVFALYKILLLFFGALVLVRAFFRHPRLYRRQAAALLIGSAMPWVGILLYVFRLTPIPGLDVTPVAFALTGLVLAWSIFRFRLFDLTPIARDVLVESMDDGVLVFDWQDRLVDANLAAQHLIGVDINLLGQPVEAVLERYPKVLTHYRQNTRSLIEVNQNDATERCLDVQINSLTDRQGRIIGRLMISRDITDRKRTEEAEHEQRILAESLRDTAATLTSTLEVSEVFERILAKVGEVVPHDAANIMMIEKDMTRIAHSRGYAERGLEEYAHNWCHRLEDFPNLLQIVETGKTLIIPDVTRFPGWVDMPETRWLRSYASAPIRIEERVVGFLNLDSQTPGFFTPVHAERLQVFADQAAIAFKNARLYAEVQRLAIVDELTGLFNYRGLIELGPREVERAHRFQRPLSIFFFDIDHFRDFNKRYSHAVGNQVLRAVAERTLAHMRSVDLVARYGGEEFVVLLPETDVEAARQVAERLRQKVEAMQVLTEYGNLGITISVGVAQLSSNTPNLATLLERADKAEHLAKSSGRNRVVVLDSSA